MKNMFNVTTILPHNLLQTNPCIRHNISTQVFRKRAAQLAFSGLQRRPEKVRKCSAAQGPHSEVVPRAFWSLVSKSFDEWKDSFARGCEVKWWSHWTCSSLGTIFQPMRINSVPDVKCFCNNKNVLCAQSMVWHFVRHPVAYMCELTTASVSRNIDFWNKLPIFTKTCMTTVAVEVTSRS